MTAPTFSVPAKKMAMWLFIIADTATFAGCLVAYGFIRNATPDWPRPFHSITNVALMTLDPADQQPDHADCECAMPMLATKPKPSAGR